MGRRRIVLFVVALCACGASAIHADVSERFDIDIRLRVDPSIASGPIAVRLKTEAEAIWEPYGIRLEWTDAGVSESAANGVFLDASVDRQPTTHQRMESPAVLGRVLLNPDAPRWRPIHVSFDATQRVLALRTTGRPAMVGVVLDHELARALGRVLAHEIGHVLLGPPYHDRAGLMRARFGAEELAELDRTPFRLTCSGVDRLRSRIRTLSGFRRSESSVGASCIPIQSTH